MYVHACFSGSVFFEASSEYFLLDLHYYVGLRGLYGKCSTIPATRFILTYMCFSGLHGVVTGYACSHTQNIEFNAHLVKLSMT
jgi:hypothetical protein